MEDFAQKRGEGVPHPQKPKISELPPLISRILLESSSKDFHTEEFFS
jgi:hypothetical protein